MPLSRRTFIAAGAAAQAASAQLPKPAGPIVVLVRGSFEPDEIRRLESAAPGIRIVLAETPADFREKLREADVVFGGINGAELDYAPKLKWVQAGGAGVEGLDEGFRKSPIVLTNMARVFAPGISETAMGLLLCLTRGITTYYMPQFTKRQMKPVGTVKSAHHVELGGKTMGIVGMGGIGCAIARRAHYGFDMRVVGTDPKAMPTPEYVSELHDPLWFEEMVPQVDVLVSAAPHTAQTERMFNEKVFRRMKKTAYFLNMSRGKLMDDLAVARALKEGWIAGAGLDVMPVEPPPSDHPIFDAPNVVMTAHTSGWSPDRQVRLVGLFAENLRRYANGLPLMNVVDKQKGY